MERDSELAADIQAVTKHGDILDAGHFTTVPGRGANAVAVVVAACLAGMESNGFGESLVMVPAFLAGSLAVAQVIRYRHHEKRLYNVADAYDRQVAVRGRLGEPVDLLRNRQLTDRMVMRWYGTDGLALHQARNIEPRLKRLADIAEQNDISAIALGVDFLDRVKGADVKVIGTVKQGSSFISDSKFNAHFLSRYTAHDNNSDVRVTECTPAQARELAELIGEVSGQSVLENIISRIDSPALSEAWNNYLVDDTQYPELKEKLRSFTQLALDMESEPVVLANVSDTGVRTRSRGYGTHQLDSADNVRVIDTVYDHDNARPYSSLRGADKLLNIVDAESLDALIERVTDDTANLLTRDLIVAAYLLVLEQDVFRRAPEQLDGARRRRSTLFDNLAEQTRWQPYGKTRKSTGEVTHELVQQPAWGKTLARRVLGSVAILVATAVGSGVGESIENLPPGAVLAKIRDYEDAAYQSIGAGGLAEWLKGQLEYEMLPKPPESNSVEYAGTSYGGIGTDFDPGDVFAGKNRDEYAVTSLHGESAAGYWYGATQNYLGLRSVYSTRPVFMDFDVSMQDLSTNYTLLPVAAHEETIERIDPDFQIDGPNVRSAGQVLPVLQGYHIVAAQFIESDGSVSPVAPEIGQDVNNSSVSLTNQIYDSKLSRELHVRYWIKRLPEGERPDYFTDNLQIAGERHENNVNDKRAVSMANRGQIKQAVTDALKLPLDATDAEIFRSIKEGKQYAVAPFHEAGIWGIWTNNSTDIIDGTNVLSTIGKTIAGLENLNCNLADVELLLATGGIFENKAINSATGYLNNDDNSLASSEYHAFIVNRDGKIIDPTPSGGFEEARAKQLITPEELLVKGTLLTIGAMTLSSLYHRRRSFVQQARRVRAAYATSHPFASEASKLILDGIYGKPSSTLSGGAPEEYDSHAMYARNVPSGMKYADFKHALRRNNREGYNELPLGLRLAVRRMFRHGDVIKQVPVRPKVVVQPPTRTSDDATLITSI